MIRLALLACSALVIAVALSACAEPQNTVAVDCHGATRPCGVLILQDHTHAMSSLAVPVSAVP